MKTRSKLRTKLSKASTKRSGCLLLSKQTKHKQKQDTQVSAPKVPSQRRSTPLEPNFHTSPVSTGATTTPTLRRVARGAGGESGHLQEFAEEMEAWNSWMLFQHNNLAQLMQELVLDVGEGLQGGDEALQKVQREVRVLEGHLKKVNVEESATREEVLQTRLVSVQEVRQNMKEWRVT